MPTSMAVFAEISSRFGVDPSDPEAITHFYEKDVYYLSLSLQDEIAKELFERESEKHTVSNSNIKYENVPYPNPKNYVRADSNKLIK